MLPTSFTSASYSLVLSMLLVTTSKGEHLTNEVV